MNLQQYFRLIIMSVFQRELTDIASYVGQRFNYDTVFFKCPRIYCKDGFNCSFQINSGNYCKTNKGYRKLGYTWTHCEFGYPSEYDEVLNKYAESPMTIDDISTVGMIPIEEAQKVIDNHGGIDLDETLSEKHYKMMVEGTISLKK